MSPLVSVPLGRKKKKGKTKERVYIFPTLYGFIFGIGALVCLFCGMAYLNNLAYLLCFFLVSLFIIGMHQSNNNLRNLKLIKFEFPIIPAHSSGVVQLWLQSKNDTDHLTLQVSATILEEQENRSKENNKNKHKKRRQFFKTRKPNSFLGGVEILKAQSQNVFPITLTTENRGQYQLGRIKISSRYPFGLFYVWRYYHWNENFLVHPELKNNGKTPNYIQKGQEAFQPDSTSGHDFREHRPYQVGDSQKHIDWKAFARGRPLLVKKYEEGTDGHFHLSIQNNTTDFESDLSNLAHWVFYLKRNHYPYSLKTLEHYLPLGFGHTHHQKALEALSVAKNLELEDIKNSQAPSAEQGSPNTMPEWQKGSL